MTDESEVREGDERAARVRVLGLYGEGPHWRVQFLDTPHTAVFTSWDLAASRLISRKAPEIKVGSRVWVSGWGGHLSVDAISRDGRHAYLWSDEYEYEYRAPLSDLTLVEDPTDV